MFVVSFDINRLVILSNMSEGEEDSSPETSFQLKRQKISFLDSIKKYAHPSSLKDGRLTDTNNMDLEIPRAFKMHRNNIELQTMKEMRLSGLAPRMRLTKQQLKYVWQSQYGFTGHTLCMCCEVTPICWDSVTANASHVVSDAQLGNPEKCWNFLYLCADCNQKGVAKAKNMFDQLAEVRLDKVLLFANVLMKM